MKLYTLFILGSIASTLPVSAYEDNGEEGVDSVGTEMIQEDNQQPQAEEASPEQPRSLKSKLLGGAKHFAKGAATGVFSGNNGDSQEGSLATTVGQGLGNLAGRATGINLTPEERAERAEQRRLKQEHRQLTTQHQTTEAAHTPSHSTSLLSKLRGGKSKNTPATHPTTHSTGNTNTQKKQGSSLLSKLRGNNSKTKSATTQSHPSVTGKKTSAKTAPKTTKSSMFSLKKSTPLSAKNSSVNSSKKTFSLGSKKTTKPKTLSSKASKVGFFSKKKANHK